MRYRIKIESRSMCETVNGRCHVEILKLAIIIINGAIFVRIIMAKNAIIKARHYNVHCTNIMQTACTMF